MDFSDIYYMGVSSFVCVQSNKSQFTSRDTNKPEYSSRSDTGSIQNDLANEIPPDDADIVWLNKVTDIVAIELLLAELDVLK